MAREELSNRIIETYEEIQDRYNFGATEDLIKEISIIKDKEFRTLKEKAPTRYPDDHIFDEEKSVRWNREELERNREAVKEYKNKISELNILYDSVIMRAIIKAIEADFDVNEEQAAIIYGKAYEDAHSSGYIEVYYYAEDYAELYERLKEAETAE